MESRLKVRHVDAKQYQAAQMGRYLSAEQLDLVKIMLTIIDTSNV
jgi:hypothetical protein